MVRCQENEACDGFLFRFNCLSSRPRKHFVISVVIHDFALANQRNPIGRVGTTNFWNQGLICQIIIGLHGFEPSAAANTATVILFFLCFPLFSLLSLFLDCSFIWQSFKKGLVHPGSIGCMVRNSLLYLEAYNHALMVTDGTSSPSPLIWHSRIPLTFLRDSSHPFDRLQPFNSGFANYSLHISASSWSIVPSGCILAEQHFAYQPYNTLFMNL